MKKLLLPNVVIGLLFIGAGCVSKQALVAPPVDVQVSAPAVQAYVDVNNEPRMVPAAPVATDSPAPAQDDVTSTPLPVAECVTKIPKVYQEEWQYVSDCLLLSNGNIWVVTRHRVVNDKGEQNPCASSKCFVESFIVDPVQPKNVVLTSSENGYLASIKVRAHEAEGYLYIDWTIGYARQWQRVRTELANIDI